MEFKKLVGARKSAYLRQVK